MQIRFNDSLNIALVLHSPDESVGGTRMEFFDVDQALTFLRNFSSDFFALSHFRLAVAALGHETARMRDGDVLATLAASLSTRRLYISRPLAQAPVKKSVPPEPKKTPKTAPPPPPPAPPPQTRANIGFVVLAITGDGDKPVADVSIKAKLPGNRIDTGKTDKKGALQLTDVKDGVCSIEEMFTTATMFEFDSIES